MGYALIVAHNGDVFGKGELATLYLAAYTALLPGRPGPREC